MSPFLVYLMFQADSIQVAFTVLAVLSSVVVIFVWLVSLMLFDTAEGPARKLCKKSSKWSIAVFALSLFMSALTPSTNTIAAMVVLPKLTSPQALDAMGSEARDVYRLAKQALANLVDDSHASKADAKSEQP